METDRILSLSFLENHPAHAALVIERLPPEDAAALLEKVSPRVAAGALERMVAASAAECLAAVSTERIAPLLAALPPDSAAALLRRLDAERRESLLAHAPTDTAALLARLLRFPEGTAGALMDPRALSFPEDITVGETLTRLRRSPRHALYYLYITDRRQAIVGVLNLRELMLAPPKALLGAVMRSHVAKLSARADCTAIVSHPGWREFHALPVVDDDGLFLGAIRYETLRQIEEKAVERRSGVEPLATVMSLGELCWFGLTGVLADLAATMLPAPASSAVKKESNHD